MKKILILTILLIATLVQAQDYNVFGFACTDDLFDAHTDKITDCLAYPMFRSDFQTEMMTNGVYAQWNFNQRVQKNNPNERIYHWRYEEPKMQKLSPADADWLIAKMDLAQSEVYYGVASGYSDWLDTFSNPSTLTNDVHPVVIGEYDDKLMQSDKLWFVSSVLPNAWDADKADWVNGWLDIAGLDHTEANTNLVEGKLIKDVYYLASDTNQAVWVIKQNIKSLDNANLEQRDVFRASVAAPYRETIGFLRNSLQDVYMNHFGIIKR